jgi:hypothetical protein
MSTFYILHYRRLENPFLTSSFIIIVDGSAQDDGAQNTIVDYLCVPLASFN